MSYSIWCMGLGGNTPYLQGPARKGTRMMR